MPSGYACGKCADVEVLYFAALPPGKLSLFQAIAGNQQVPKSYLSKLMRFLSHIYMERLM